MASRNAYLRYKYETSRIIYWIVQTSNKIIRSSPTNASVDATIHEKAASGQVTVAGLVALAKLIGGHIDKTPAVILSLFRSVIDARAATHATFQQLAAQTSDPDIMKSNESHKLFIDALQLAFDALGGDAALKAATEVQGQKASGQSAVTDQTNAATVQTKDDMDQIILTNKFDKLDIEGIQEADAESEEEAAPAKSTPARRKQVKPGKGKQGKQPKKPKRSAGQEAEVEPLPLESYRIIQDTEGHMTDYVMAVYEMMHQIVTLRCKMQEIWREVAYDGLNTAVAGAVSHIAVGMVQRTAAAMFVEFPGHDSFETVMNTITRGNVEKSQGMFTVLLYRQPAMEDSDGEEIVVPGGPGLEKVVENHIDVKEQFLIHAYNDLLDFVLDFQKNRTGKPTKKMLAEIKDWDPKFDLQRATNEERVKWRRSYTINWLYDLVNVFSSVVVQCNTQKKEGHVLENVDWSTTGPWGVHRLIYGLEDFAAFVTSLAMQKPATDIRKRILPHHVFQLQLIVDSWTNERVMHGFLQGAHVLEQMLEKEGAEVWGPAVNEYEQMIELIRLMRLDFTDWLGESKYMHGLNTIPPSRFSKSNSNGLWEYSPMLCGTGLTEALVLAYEFGLWAWDRTPEVTYLIHLHNMLYKRGFIRQPVGLFASIEEMFPECFYPGGKIPDSDFDQVLFRHVARANRNDRSLTLQRKAAARTAGNNLSKLFSAELNMFFKAKSDLLLYYQANWDPDRVPDAELYLGSVLLGFRLSETKRIIDPATGEPKLEETELVRRMKEVHPDSVLDKLARGLPMAERPEMPELPESVRRQIEQQFEQANPGYSSSWRDRPPPGAVEPRSWTTKRRFQGLEVTDDVLLEMLKLDIMRDIILSQIEEALEAGNYKMYRDVYGSRAPELGSSIQKRYALVTSACTSNGREALRTIGSIFEDPRAGFMNHIYWDDLLQDLELPKTKARREQEEILANEPNMSCSVV
ncbi:hypothetical protein QBC37DRAFT_447678 [Rhypophila decipiens]|uniref:DUF6604 domain-containing protein n=1 Tax=Rhypophila decipiens TaxID=261697 RepID=A0AAN6Y3I1_9PEZI|nr:hypothetical protein QBC37DRAFT_447678 [Rhypophila decipiens]